jgi:YegS/Rv2252/BmrU family lipid kinase
MSEGPGHLADLARRAVADGARVLVVVGGDGSVHESVNGLVGTDEAREVELAVLPRGTGKDFVRSLRIPRDLRAAIGVARNWRVRTIDVGRARFVASGGSSAEAYFANFAGAGISGAIARRANASSKVTGGRVSFLLATVAVFAGWKNAEIQVTVDAEVRSGPMFDVIVANCRYLAGGMKIAPDAEPDDGLFDVLLIGDISKLDLALTMPKIYRGTHLPHPKAELLRGASVSVDAEEPLPVELDGEQPGTTPVRFEVVPRALRLRVPS